jgi:hypothetical protein
MAEEGRRGAERTEDEQVNVRSPVKKLDHEKFSTSYI